MRVLCRKAISRTTKEDLGVNSPWLKIGKEYIVLALNYEERSGIDIYIQTEDNNEPRFINLSGFEVISQKIPSNWITTISENYGRTVVTILPASWNYIDFFEDMENQDAKAIGLFNKEAEFIYNEELS